MNRIPLNHPCLYKHHLEKSTGNHKKADSNYHAVVWRPIGGVTDEQIKLLYNQFRKDLGDRQPRIAHRGTFSIEGKGAARHVHIALILIGRAETWVTSSRYKAVLGDKALLDGCSVNGNKIPKKVALLCCQPECNKMPNYKQTTWLAYPVKEAAMNPNFTPADYDNGSTRRMGFVFDGIDGVELKDARTRFETALKTAWHSKLVSTNYIYHNKSMDTLANEFFPIHCPDMPWCKANRAEVLAKMYLHEGRFLKYEFAANFFKEKYIGEKLFHHCDDEDFYDQVVDAIKRTFDIIENGGKKPKRGRSAKDTESIKVLQEWKQEWTLKEKEWTLKEKELTQENERQKSIIHKFDTKQKTLEQNLEVLTSELAWCINRGYPDEGKTTYLRHPVYKEMDIMTQMHHRYSNKRAKQKWELGVIEKWRGAEELSKQQQKQAAIPVAIPQSPRPKKRQREIHSCDACNDCSVEERVDCGKGL